MTSESYVWFITGANSGYGLLLTQLVLSKGHTVIATARSLDKFPPELRSNPNADLLEVQITSSEDEIARAINASVLKHGRIDVLVNNAGFAHVGATEEVTETEARHQMDVNFFGVFNFTKAVIPHMRKQGSGDIVQISSGLGFLSSPGAAVYAASKQAIEGLSEGLAGEVKSFGIRVRIVEPGISRTNFYGPVAQGKNISQRKDGYADMASMLTGMDGKQPGDPKKGVQRIFEVVTGTGEFADLQDQLRIPLGSDAWAMLETKLAMLGETHSKLKELAYSTDF